jgi:hypothetical protein
MNNKYLLVFLLMNISTLTFAQYVSGVTQPDTTLPKVMDDNDLSYRYAKSITAEEMKEHLSILASDEFEGRETGKEGNLKASSYIANALEKYRVKGGGENQGYFQPVAFTFSKWLDTEIYVNGERYRHMWDFLTFPQDNDSRPIFTTDEVVFLGYGIDDPVYSDYKKKKVAGKVIMINKGEPMKKDSVTSWITKDTTLSDWSTDISKKLIAAKKHGVELVLIIEDDIKKLLSENRRKLLGGTMQLGDKSKEENPYANHCYISTTIAKALIGDKQKKVIKSRKYTMKKGKNCDVKLDKFEFSITQLKETTVLESRNVLGIVEGTDKKDEYVIVSAHLDHLGKRGDAIYNGADDNGSGTTTILEIAEAFARAARSGDRPRRSVVFLWVTGEEKGLLGSNYYANNPIYPLEQTMVNVNVDMVGRVDKVYEPQGIEDYIYVIGSDRLSSDLHKINEEVNQKYSQLILDYTYNDEADPNRFYYRSDHYNFAKNGIPAIFYFNGTHKDYHQVSDTVEKINFEKMEKIGRLIFHTTWELANREEKIVVDGEVR